MPIRLTFDSSVPSVVADSLSDLVDRANASGVYASGETGTMRKFSTRYWAWKTPCASGP